MSTQRCHLCDERFGIDGSHVCPLVKWMDIETAPKDGQLLLCDEEGIRTVGFWGKHNHVPMYGWLRQVELYGEEVDGFDAVWWQPLPPAPTAPTEPT